MRLARIDPADVPKPTIGIEEELQMFIDDVVDALGSRRECEHILTIAREGTSADRQIRVWQETGHFHKVVDAVCEETIRGVPEVVLD